MNILDEVTGPDPVWRLQDVGLEHVIRTSNNWCMTCGRYDHVRPQPPAAPPIDPDGMYLVEWPDSSKRLLFGNRLIIFPTGSAAKITPLQVKEPRDA